MGKKPDQEKGKYKYINLTTVLKLQIWFHQLFFPV